MSARFEETWRCNDPLRYSKPDRVAFLTAEQYMAAALKAYFAALKNQIPPKGETWFSTHEGSLLPWAGPEDFYLSLQRELDDRIRAAAIKNGALVRKWFSAAQFAANEADELSTQIELHKLFARPSGELLQAAGGAP